MKTNFDKIVILHFRPTSAAGAARETPAGSSFQMLPTPFPSLPLSGKKYISEFYSVTDYLASFYITHLPGREWGSLLEALFHCEFELYLLDGDDRGCWSTLGSVVMF